MNVSIQRSHAIDAAHEIRTGIAEFRRMVAGLDRVEAALTVAAAIKHDHQDRILGAARVGHVLKAIPWVGVGKVEKGMRFAGIQDSRTRLRDLTENQRDNMVLQLEILAELWSA